MLQIDELLDPDNPTLDDQRNTLAYEIQESIKPPVLSGPASQLKAIREVYVSNKIALQMEHLPVDDNTPSFAFWQYLIAVDKKYKASLPHGNAS